MALDNGDKERLNNIVRAVSNNTVDIKEIKDNHLSHIKNELNKVKVDMTEVKTDMSWVKRWFWLVATASVAGLIAQLYNILFK